MKEILESVWSKYIEAQKAISDGVERLAADVQQAKQRHEELYQNFLNDTGSSTGVFEDGEFWEAMGFSKELWAQFKDFVEKSSDEVRQHREASLADFRKMEEDVAAVRAGMLEDRQKWEAFVKKIAPSVSVRWLSADDVMNCETSNGWLFLEDGSVQEKPQSVC